MWADGARVQLQEREDLGDHAQDTSEFRLRAKVRRSWKRRWSWQSSPLDGSRDQTAAKMGRKHDSKTAHKSAEKGSTFDRF